MPSLQALRYEIDLIAPAKNVEAVTTAVSINFRALYVSNTGNVKVHTASSSAIFSSVPAGTILAVKADSVSGSTATGIIALGD